MKFAWHKIDLADHRFLSLLASIIDHSGGSAELLALMPEGAGEFSRQSCNGLITIRATVGGRPAGILINDFRMNGGSFGHENSRRFVAFLQEMERERAPVLYVANSLGVRIMEGRKVFTDAFGVWPILLRFASKNLLITCAFGKTLGLSALLFGLGHYRLAVAEGTHINLTGPEVLKLFFGEDFDFDAFASADRQVRTTDLIHELSPTKEAALARARYLLICRQSSAKPGDGAQALPAVAVPSPNLERIHRKMMSLIARIGENPVELFSQMSPIVRIFLVERAGRKLGIFINPPGNPNNMITVDALQKYGAGLDFFKALRIPVISLLDAPGADPRHEQSDRNNIRVMLNVGEKIIRYPYGKMGVVIGRCYGGATTLGFPKAFGGQRIIVLKGAALGIMHETIIRQVLSGSSRLMGEWEEVAKRQTEDLRDLMADGTVDAVVDETSMGAEVDVFLHGLESLPEPQAFVVREEMLGLRRRPSLQVVIEEPKGSRYLL